MYLPTEGKRNSPVSVCVLISQPARYTARLASLVNGLRKALGMNSDKYNSYAFSRVVSMDRQTPGYLQCAILLFAIVVGCQSSALAEWTGGVEGGTVLRDSNTASRLRLTLRNNERPLTHYLYAEWLRFDGVGNDLSIGYNPRYWFDETYYVFGESGFRTVNTLGIDRDLTVISGVGGQFINDNIQTLFAEVGVGGRSLEFDESEEAITETLGVARVGYNRVFADSFRFDLSFRTIASSEEVNEAISEVGLSVRVPNGSIRAAYRNRYFKSGDAEAISDGDTLLSFGLGF